MLSGWSAASTPLLLFAIGMAFLPQKTTATIPTILVWALVFFGIEAAARRHLAGYLVAVLVLAVVLILALAFAIFVVKYGWRYAITGTFLGLAVILLVANSQELGRD